jgi:hypothetical protein
MATVKACGQCGKPMQTEIAPVGSGRGFVPFFVRRAAQPIVSVEPVKRNAGGGHGHGAIRCRISGHAQRRRPLVLGGHHPTQHVIKRGIADTEPAACKQAGDAAREAHLIE